MLLPRSPGVRSPTPVNVQGDPHYKGVTEVKMLTASAYRRTRIGNSAINNASPCADLYGTIFRLSRVMSGAKK